jgi:hypothetical protein
MDYKKIYDNLMESRLLLKEERIKLRKQGEYFEAHHIIPKCMGGQGKATGYKNLIHPNIVVLTAREHYIAHALLFLIYRTRELMYSFHFFCTIRKGKNYTYKVSSRMYEFLKQERSRLGVSQETREKIGQANSGKKRSQEQKERYKQMRIGKKMSPESVAKREETKKRNILLGITNPYIRSPEHMEKMRKNNVMTEERREKIRQANLGKKRSQEQKEKMRNAKLGKKLSPEHREKIGQTQLGRKISAETITKGKETKERNKLLGLTKPRIVSSETREKIRQSHLGKKQLSETIAKRVETRKRNRLLKLAHQQQETQNN